MRIYQLRVEGSHRPAFYAELPPNAILRSREEPGRPRRHRLERRVRKVKALLLRSVRRAPEPIKGIWDRLNQRTKPDETLVRVLRQAAELTIVHPSTISSPKAAKAWRAFLRSKLREHSLTLVWDVVLAPLVTLLMILPGPNVIGYWFLYRFLIHLLAIRGVVRVRLGGTPVNYEASPVLDTLVPADADAGDPEIRRIGRAFGLNHLGLFLRRQSGQRGRSSDSIRGRGPTTPTTPIVYPIRRAPGST